MNWLCVILYCAFMLVWVPLLWGVFAVSDGVLRIAVGVISSVYTAVAVVWSILGIGAQAGWWWDW